MAALSFRSDPARTKERLHELQKYFRKEVFTSRNRFVCRSEGDCRRSAAAAGVGFHEGQLHHIGPHYDLYVEKKPLRIVVAGMSYGSEKTYVSVPERTEVVVHNGPLKRPQSAPGDRRAWNLHMSGTVFAVRLALGLGLDKLGPATEFVRVGPSKVHILEMFALVNFLLCSAIEPGSKSDRSTAEMQSNCARHFQAALEILEPTIIVGQGAGRWMAQAGLSRCGLGELEELRLGGRQMMFVNLPHPAERSYCCWGSANRPYLRETVAPRIREARARALA
jgi:hypothetical protein